MKDINLIEEGAGELSRALGMTDERANELQEICCDLVNKFDNTAEVIDLAQVYAKHPNEQAFINFRIGICTVCPAKTLREILEERMSNTKERDEKDDLDDFYDKLDD